MYSRIFLSIGAYITIKQINNQTKLQLLSTPAADHWKKIGIRHHHGINLPLFSLHSQNSCGIGEYPDLLPMITWCRQTGFDVIQLLPLNDTGDESSPYCAISANALNPIHLGLTKLTGINNNLLLQQQINELQKLNSLKNIDYKQIRQLKEKFFSDYYQTQVASLPLHKEYQEFKWKNPWLLGYAFFKVLKKQFNWQSWELWPEYLKNPDLTRLEEMSSVPEIHHEMEFYIFIQFLCFQQIEEVRQFATENNIFLKGDIPILINKESADVWLNRKLFLMQYTAGAPPDMYSKEGQNWGFPIYDWSALQNEFYQWWIERLKVASCCYHMYRIDHIVGFYRIWAILNGHKPKEGIFIPEDESSWIPQGDAIMRMMLNNCPMLPIGEDLGTIPEEVRSNLKSLGICGTKVMRWERYWLSNKAFIDPLDYDEESMSTVSTHDSETLQLWWTHQPEAKLYAKTMGWKYQSELTQEHRISILQACHQSGSLFHINLFQEYLALIPDLSWPNPEDDRINFPGTVSERNWTYRFKPSVEEIVQNQALKLIISQILT
ncbi:MAG: 4-alpha-glucanotransferase [Parachlamydiaceae bacterium]|nr:4-alpha-glucanotransferase [Parachlamydiaceae bacterium]